MAAFTGSSKHGVSVKMVATLSGFADNYTQKLAAEQPAMKVTGTRAIAEDISIGVLPYDKKQIISAVSFQKTFDGIQKIFFQERLF